MHVRVPAWILLAFELGSRCSMPITSVPANELSFAVSEMGCMPLVLNNIVLGCASSGVLS